MGLLFVIALWGDRTNALGSKRVSRRWVYSLALAVYCTSWTFYGAVGIAADSLWSYLPIYLGPLLVYTLGIPLIRRIVDGAQRHNLTSVADFISARYGSDRLIATLVTLICVVAIVPYVALQLKGIAIGVDVMAAVDSPESSASFSLSALLIASALAVFAILFGTRHASSRESQQGLLIAIAFESAVKLFAFVVVGVLAWSHFGSIPLLDFVVEQTPITEAVSQPSFLTQTLLAGLAVMCLPRQFHVAAVEYTQPKELKLARWVFSGYLVVVAIFVIPIVAFGLTASPSGSNPDGFVLFVPAALNEPLISLLVFLGGVSAASAMVIVSSIALGTMISNEIVLPRLVDLSSIEHPENYLKFIKRVRRFSITGIIALAYFFYLRIETNTSLASTGLLAFVGIAQLAPAMLIGLFWDGATRKGAVAALCVGAGLWFWIMLLPVLAPNVVAAIDSSFIPKWLSPSGFFGFSEADSVSRAAWASLGTNTFALVVVSLLTNHRPEFYRDARRFLTPGAVGAQLSLDAASAKRLLGQFFGHEQALALVSQKEFGSENSATYERAAYCEGLLSGLMGTATARQLVEQYSRVGSSEAEAVLNYATQVVDFSRELLQASLQNIGVAVSVIDANQRLVAWNSLYQSMFGFPDKLLTTGTPIENLVRFNADRGLLGKGDRESLIEIRLKRLQDGLAYKHERELPDGSYLEIRGAPMPNGGFITTYTDISEYKKLQHNLEQANTSLEARVNRRTEELQHLNGTLQEEVQIRRKTELALNDAKVLAEQANASKTHFLAAATHDLMQPLNSARLFSAVLAQNATGDTAQTAANIEQSLDSMEQMLSTLLDISKLDAGVLPVNRSNFSVGEMLSALKIALATVLNEAEISLSLVHCTAVIESDPAHLKRIVQNFLVNALRYTGKGGRIVLGVRRSNNSIRIEVWDNGPGIDKDQQELIFEEFRRGGDSNSSDNSIGPRGSGLGLSISRRLAALLGHKIHLKSEVGRGSVFSITVPLAAAGAKPHKLSGKGQAIGTSAGRFDGLAVLCIDNEPQVLAGMVKLLDSWGCTTQTASCLPAALEKSGVAPSILLVDFHLENNVSGIDVIAKLRQHFGVEIPAVLITADHTEEAKNAAQAAGVPLLRKPVKPAALGALISRLTTE